MTPARRVALHVGTCLMALVPPAAAAGQDSPTTSREPAVPGGVVVERVETGTAAGFDVKFVTVDGESGIFLGSSGGRLFGGKLFVGAGVYLRMDRAYPEQYRTCKVDMQGIVPVRTCRDETVSESGDIYGGLLVGWRALRTGPVSIGFHGLVGAGMVKLGWTGTDSVVSPALPITGPGSPSESLLLYDQGYVVFEPQMDVTVAVGKYGALVGAVGYRVVGYANGLDHRLRGLTSSFSFRMRVPDRGPVAAHPACGGTSAPADR